MKVHLISNSLYQPPYTFKSLFSDWSYVHGVSKNAKFIHVKVSEEDYTKTHLLPLFKFNYSKPNFADNANDVVKYVAQLQKTKLDVYKNFYPFDDEKQRMKFEEAVSKIGGLISGQVRSFRSLYIMTVLTQFHDDSPKLFDRFSLSQWRIFSNYLFDKAPTKENLMLLSNKKNNRLSNYSYHQTEASSRKIIACLLSQYQKEVDLVRSDYEQACNELSDSLNRIKQRTNKEITSIKKSK